MLSQHIIDQLQPYDFDRLARREHDGRRRLRLIALAHLKDGKSYLEVAAALRVTRQQLCAGCNGLPPAAWPVWPVCRMTGARSALPKSRKRHFDKRSSNFSANAAAGGCRAKTSGSLAWPTT